jgi:hypothetical protein
MPNSIQYLIFTLLVVMGTTGLLAQETEELPPRHLRLIAVGETPPFRQEIRDGVRYELDAPAGSLPPGEITFSYEGQESPEEEGPAPLRLELGGPTSGIELPGAEITLEFLVDGERWHRLRLPEGGDYLAVLWRSSRTGDWTAASSLLVPDGGEFLAGEVRFINVGPVPIGVEIKGVPQFELAPGKTERRELGQTPGTPIRIVYRDGRGQWHRLWSSALTQNVGERNTVLIYRADGEQPRRPLKILSIREKVNPLQPEKSRQMEK